MKRTREHALICAIGQALLPEGAKMPAFTAASADRVLSYLEAEGPSAQRAFRSFLRTVDLSARARFGRGLLRLSETRRLDILRMLHEGSAATRLLCKLGFAPIKTLHLDDPRIYRSLGCQYRAAPAGRESNRQMRQQIFDGASLEGLQTMETEVVVVGSGAGGAVVAAELARRGHEVMILEAGEHLDRADFTAMSRPEMTQRAYRSLTETTTLGNTVIPILVGSLVGGSTTVNSGTCFRTPDDVLESWVTERGLPELSPEAMSPYFARVEEVLQIAPATPSTLAGSAHVIARGCDALGYAHGPLHRNAPGCDGQGVCVFGCPTDAKRSTNVSYVPMALRAGALMVTGAEVTSILTKHGTAYGVAARVKTPEGTQQLNVRAKRVVLSCGALYTPVLMMRNGLGRASRHLGRHLSVHPATSAYALMSEEVNGDRGIPQGYAIEEFRHEGVMFEGAFTPLEFLALDLPFLGGPLVEALESYRHLAAFGIMVKDGSSSGRITLGPQGRRQLWYNLGKREVAVLKRAMSTLAEVFRAAGAKEIYLPLRRHPRIRSEADLRRLRASPLRARDFELSAYHPLGTARMAPNASEGVVDSDHEVYGVNRLHVVDASVVPTSLGVNPQVTIMAMATRAAEQLARRLDGDAR